MSSREVHTLKIVVIRSPKFISGILRAIFGIKKEEQ
ncbi:MAG: stage V sporulation protein SpoVM [Ruminococcus sp.]|nr:stage V sporulation protein SpoVM [Ruminococcus sp.]